MDYQTTHTSLSPIWRGFAPGFVNFKKGCTRLAATSDKIYQLLAHGQWFSPGTPDSSTTKTGRHDIAEILLKVVLSTINQSSRMVKCPHISTFKFDSDMDLIFFTVLTIRFSSNSQMEIWNQPMLKCFRQKNVETKNQTENCIMWLHLYSKLLLFKLLHMLFRGSLNYMKLTRTMKIGIQRIQLSIHTISEKLRKLHSLHITQKLINLSIVFFIIMLYCTQY